MPLRRETSIDQRQAEDRERDADIALPQARQRRHEVGPGVEPVPARRDVATILRRKNLDPFLAEQFAEHVAMHLVDVEARLDGAEHPLQRAAAVLVGEPVPVAFEPVPGAARGECPGETAVPVEDGASGIEGQRLDPLHRRDPLHPCPSAGARPSRRHHEIADDQPQPLVLARLQGQAQGMDRRPGRGLVPQPVAELAARRPGGAGRRRFQAIGLHIVDCETQGQRRGKALARARRRLAAKPVGDIPGSLPDRQSAQPDRGAAMLGNPPLMRALQQQDLRLEPRRERGGRLCCDRGGDERRPPGGIGLRARVVIGKILDDDRAALALQEPQGGEDHPLLECRLAGRTERAPELERNPKRPRRLGVFGLRPDQADRDRRDALFLEIMPQRAHGARAERSNGGEDDGVDLVVLQPVGEAADVRLHLHRVGGAHERVMGLGERADRALGGQLAQPVEREDDVPILLKPGAVEIDRDVAAQQVFGLGRRWDRPVIRIAPAKRVFAAHDEARRGDDRHPALSQRRPGNPGPGREIGAFELGQALRLPRGQIGQSRHAPLLESPCGGRRGLSKQLNLRLSGS